MYIISACLCGVNCKYNGKNNLNEKQLEQARMYMEQSSLFQTQENLLMQLKNIRCVHRHSIETHPACFAQGRVNYEFENDREW